jgi:LPS-assembly lipoprotein
MRLVMRALGVCALLGGPLALSGCGFAPLYAQQGLTTSLSDVALDLPDTRTGFFLGQDLRNGLATDGVPPKPYLLSVTMTERHFNIGYRVDETTTRSEITSNVVYVLTNAQTGTTLLRDTFTETVTYDTSTSPFTGVVSQQDAQERIATAVAQKLQADLALYFHDHASR